MTQSEAEEILSRHFAQALEQTDGDVPAATQLMVEQTRHDSVLLEAIVERTGDADLINRKVEPPAAPDET